MIFDFLFFDFYVYVDVDENFYVYYDFMFFVFFLCVEWLDFFFGFDVNGVVFEGVQFGNYVVVGFFDFSIEIWDVDFVDGFYFWVIFGLLFFFEKLEVKFFGIGKKK